MDLGRKAQFRPEEPAAGTGNRGTVTIGSDNIFGFWGARRSGNGEIRLAAWNQEARIVIGN